MGQSGERHAVHGGASAQPGAGALACQGGGHLLCRGASVRRGAALTMQADAYGQCMLAKYKRIEKDACAIEFAAFKGCVQKVMGRKW